MLPKVYLHPRAVNVCSASLIEFLAVSFEASKHCTQIKGIFYNGMSKGNLERQSQNVWKKKLTRASSGTSSEK